MTQDDVVWDDSYDTRLPLHPLQQMGSSPRRPRRSLRSAGRLSSSLRPPAEDEGKQGSQGDGKR